MMTEAIVPARTAPEISSRGQAWLDIFTVLAPGAVVFVAGSYLGIFLSGPLGVLISTALVWWVCKRRGGGLSMVGMGRPRSWLLTGLFVIATFIGGGIFINLLVQPLALKLTGSLPDASALQSVEGNLGQLIQVLVISWTTAAFGEEIVFRGFLMPWLRRAIGGGAWAMGVALVAQAALFGVAHSYQGAAGMIVVAGVGLVMGASFLLCKRNLWVAILTHGLIDTIAMLALFFGLLPGTG